MLTFIKKNKNRGKIEFKPEDRHEFDLLREQFKTENKSARFARQFAYAVNPWKYPIAQLGAYQIGMTINFINKCIEKNIPYQIDSALKSFIFPQLHINNIEPVPNKLYQYRDYQLSMIEIMAKSGRGVILSPTRSGKSLILSGLFHNVFLNYNKNKIKTILLVVPNLQLVQQMQSDINDYYSNYNRKYIVKFKNSENSLTLADNEEIELNGEFIYPKHLKRGMKIFGKEIKSIKLEETILSKSPWDIIEFSAAEDKSLKGKWEFPNTNKIIITNSQWLLLHGDKLPRVDMIVLDEVHTAKNGSEIAKIIQDVDIPYKFGCTGTLPEDETDKWTISGIFGPVLKQIKVTELQAKNVLTTIQLQPIKLIHAIKENFKQVETSEDGNKMMDIFTAAQREYQKESMYLGMYEKSNQKIINLAENLIDKKPEWNVLILFDYISQGESLYQLCKSQYKHFIDGSIKVSARQAIVEEANKHGSNIIIGNTKCVGTGLTLKNIHCIILCIVGKSATKTIQAVGRGMATNNKSNLLLFDVFHNYKYSEKHFIERCEKYREYYNLILDKNFKTKNLIL